ncbi:MAG: hypothetical protein WA771_05970, partial [Chthoniobacterales bacterium]
VVEMDVPSVGPMKMLGTPMRLHSTPATVRQPPPGLGEHSRTIASELGYSAEEIDRMFEERILS